MARKATGLSRLTPLQVAKAKPGDRLSDGGGLYLVCGEGNGATRPKAWAFYYFAAPGKRRELGLGSLDDLPLVAARELAATLRESHTKGIDPETERDRLRADAAPASAPAPAVVTFKQAAEECIRSKRAGWRNAKHSSQWTATLETYAYPIIGDTAVADIDGEAVLKVLQPIWTVKPETASRVRGRIEAVLSYAKVREWRSGENPALWKGNLDQLLPARNKVRKPRNHPACVVDDAPTLYRRLVSSGGAAAAATCYCLLTAARPGEVTHARWPEIDRTTDIWTVPPGRQKSDKPHRVPLSSEALAILEAMWSRREDDTGYVFPGGKKGRPLSLTALQKALRVAMGEDLRTDQEGRAATTHGTARSTFDDWGSERTHHPQKLIDRALAHGPKSKTIAAYRRSELFEQRKPLMADWATFLSGERATVDNIVPLRGADTAAA